MWRIIWRLVCFWKADERRQQLGRDLNNAYNAARGKADHSSRDYMLKRDLESINEDKNRRR